MCALQRLLDAITLAPLVDAYSNLRWGPRFAGEVTRCADGTQYCSACSPCAEHPEAQNSFPHHQYNNTIEASIIFKLVLARSRTPFAEISSLTGSPPGSPLPNPIVNPQPLQRNLQRPLKEPGFSHPRKGREGPGRLGRRPPGFEGADGEGGEEPPLYCRGFKNPQYYGLIFFIAFA